MPSSRKNVLSLSLSLLSCSFCSRIILSINSWCLFSDLSSMAKCSCWISISWSCMYSLFFCFFCFFFSFGAELPGHRRSPHLKHLLRCSNFLKKIRNYTVLIKNLIFKDYFYLVKKQFEDWGFIPKLNALPKLTGPKNF